MSITTWPNCFEEKVLSNYWTLNEWKCQWVSYLVGKVPLKDENRSCVLSKRNSQLMCRNVMVCQLTNINLLTLLVLLRCDILIPQLLLSAEILGSDWEQLNSFNVFFFLDAVKAATAAERAAGCPWSVYRIFCSSDLDPWGFLDWQHDGWVCVLTPHRDNRWDWCVMGEGVWVLQSHVCVSVILKMIKVCVICKLKQKGIICKFHKTEHSKKNAPFWGKIMFWIWLKNERPKKGCAQNKQ